MMGVLRLSDKQWDEVDRLRFSAGDAKVFRNCLIILMSDREVGHSRRSIAQDLGCSPGTVDSVRQRYRQQGIAGLAPRKSTGRPPRVTRAYRLVLRKVVQTPPQQFGYGFGVWSVARLNAHLKQSTGLALSDERVRRLLGEEGFSFQRPKHTMKGKRDEAAYEKAGRQLKRLKKGRSNQLATLS
jgi:transposase